MYDLIDRTRGSSDAAADHEMLRMNLKRAAAETIEESCPLASRAVHAEAPGAVRC